MERDPSTAPKNGTEIIEDLSKALKTPTILNVRKNDRNDYLLLISDLLGALLGH
jgi:hypothetical protein